MAYVEPNYATKKALTEALKNGEDVIVYQPGLGDVPTDGEIDLEGPHYPAAHKWWATGVMLRGRLVRAR